MGLLQALDPDQIPIFQSRWSCIHFSGQILGSLGVVTRTLGICISECELADENFRPPLSSTIIRLPPPRLFL